MPSIIDCIPGKVAGILAEYGSDKPKTSRAVPMVFALITDSEFYISQSYQKKLT